MTLKKTMRFQSGSMVKGLHDLCKDVDGHFNGKHIEIVELGSYAGESASIFLQILDCSITCVDAWMPNVKYKENDIHDAGNRFNMLLRSNTFVRQFKGDTCDQRLIHVKGIDLVYIDADHSYEAVKRDILFWRDKCTVIAGHDYEDAGKYGVKKAVDEIFGKPDRVYADSSWIIFKSNNK